ncbi:hypothetical protein JFU04_17485 [Pseudomonas sp. TH21]|uniref:methionyl-tRNA formyltransferase n=1 Tax=Pseudomonas sp. TH21 TaxID=2796387 RepID=UPI00191449EB|nr:formyltransferase family protein [Pseudomonas sp. TH21]MBK5477882.1 hypothetical protein [Pseudomonas sp. TH21]
MADKSLGFYLLGKKGYKVLEDFIAVEGGTSVAFVVAAIDKNVDKDFYVEIKHLCLTAGVRFFDRQASDIPSGDWIFCIGWRWILSVTAQVVVFHDSLLPKYRGFSPLPNMLINGEPKIGLTALKASEKYDAGDILASASVDVSYPITIFEAIEKIIPLYSELVLNVYRGLHSGNENCIVQEESEASYSLWRDEEDYSIDWQRSAEFIARFCDAVGAPYRGAKSNFNNGVIRILKACPVADVNIEDRKSHVGKIIFKDEGLPIVICGEGLLKITSAELPGSSLELQNIPFRTRFR